MYFQTSWNNNLASLISCFVFKNGILISKKTIYDNLCHKDRIANFDELVGFFKKFNIECTHLYSDDISQLSLNTPAMALVKGYRTVWISKISKMEIEYFDASAGNLTVPPKIFNELSTGHYYQINYDNYIPEEDAKGKIEAEQQSARIVKEKWVAPTVREITPEVLMKEFNVSI